ncbi:type II toxin-antitoxin system RelE/ParE family toxin [Patescibacteria group bacterium]|nr:type II toxin-antitoxin system RelE/ParE family toxin [Patescibacteria group bacterium]MBU1884986.1 type II toxin-antitoxin system RelE/ParE family toxin [Patescibacteria group bacterium]
MISKTNFSQYFFTPNSKKQFDKLPQETKKRIHKKLKYYCESKNPAYFARTLSNSKLGQYRFRIGEYRIIFDFRDKTKLVILKIGHRREIYR